MSEDLGVDATEPGWTRYVALGHQGAAMAVLFYPDGTVRFRHRCDRGERGIITCAPRLRIGEGHTVVQERPLTIVASILCPDCGLHGWVTDGAWRAA